MISQPRLKPWLLCWVRQPCTTCLFFFSVSISFMFGYIFCLIPLPPTLPPSLSHPLTPSLSPSLPPYLPPSLPPAPPVWAAILLSTSPIAGQPLTLTCTVTLAPGTAATPTVTWTGPAVNSGIQATPSSGEYTLSFEVLQEAFYGSYGCMATAGVESSEHTVSVVGDGEWACGDRSHTCT